MLDVLIVGAGIVGTLVARALSVHRLRVALADRASDVGAGATRANSAIVHSGYDPEPGTAKARLNAEGNREMEGLCRALHVPFRRNGSLVVAFDPEEEAMLRLLLDRGRRNGVPGLALLDPGEVRSLEPAVSDRIVAALLAPTGGIVSPYGLAVAAAEVAVANGVGLWLDSELVALERLPAATGAPGSDGRRGFRATLRDPDGVHRVADARYVVDAAGVYADDVARLAGDNSFRIRPRKGEYLLYDTIHGSLLSHTIFQVPSERGKGVLATPTVDGNLLVGPTSVTVEDKDDLSTTPEGLREVFRSAVRSVPAIGRLPSGDTITSFAGLRATPDTPGHDFLLGESALAPGLVLAAGIESPGLTAAPAIARRILGILSDAGLDLVPDPAARMDRDPPVRFRDLSDGERAARIRQDPLFGRILCRCEQVTEAEVLDAIRRPAGARDLDAVKRRTRAGMGRCQGGFCVPRVMAVLARELRLQEEEVTKHGPGSRMLQGRMRAP